MTLKLTSTTKLGLSYWIITVNGKVVSECMSLQVARNKMAAFRGKLLAGGFEVWEVM